MHPVPQTGRSAGHAAPVKAGATPTDPAAFNAVLAVAAKTAATPAKARHATASATTAPGSGQHAAAQVPAFALFQLPHAMPDPQPAARRASSGPAPAVTAATAGSASTADTAASAGTATSTADTAGTPSRPAMHAAAADGTMATPHAVAAETAAAAPIAPAPAGTPDATQIDMASSTPDKVPPAASAPAAAAQLPATPAPAAKLAIAKIASPEKPVAASAIAAATPPLPAAPSPAALAAVTAPAAAPAQPSAPVTTPPPVTALPDAASIAATPAALAASITAMHRNGQTSALLRLDPPGLGTLSIHLALGHEDSGGAGQVNLLMVPAVTQTAQLLNSGIDSLRQALAAAGLSLGQAQIGQGGQGGQNPAPERHSASTRTAPATVAAVTGIATNSPGVRAYA